MRDIWYTICDTLDEYKENRFSVYKKSFAWDVLDVIGSDTPILQILMLLGEFILFLFVRKNRRP